VSSSSSSALPAGSVSALQVARSARALAASVGLRCRVALRPGAVVAVSFSSPSEALHFESWCGEAVFSSGYVRQCIGFADAVVDGSTVLLSGF
jgi:hypothetical protein